MTMRAPRDAGESLIEIICAIVIISLTVTALVAGLATAGNAGNAHWNATRADAVMRDFAEATKFAVQSCVEGGTYRVDYQPDDPAFHISPEPADVSCPSADGTQELTLVVTGPSASREEMRIVVRTP